MILLNGISVNSANDRFPDGTPAFNDLETAVEKYGYLKVVNKEGPNRITWKFDNMGELFDVIAIKDWLRENFPETAKAQLHLRMPYIPNARMDRVKGAADVFTLKTFCRLINDCKFDRVEVTSAHSNVSLALLNNVHNFEPVTVFLDQNGGAYDTLFLPDEGAVKRYTELKAVKEFPIVSAQKKRDWVTAKILGLKIVGDVADIKDKNILIIDDICSRGHSFKFSAIELKKLGAKNIELFVTHCENVIDIAALRKAGITKVWTTDSIYRGSDEFVKII